MIFLSITIPTFAYSIIHRRDTLYSIEGIYD